ncbi:MAG: glycosyltransferase family 2 protein [Halieaceae bacterium]
MCTCNGEPFIEKMLRSILDQEVPPVEVVIFDDASEDNTVNILERMAKTTGIPVIVTVNESRLGVTRNFEVALQACSGDFVALADQDDQWYPDKLKRVSAQIERNSTRVPTVYLSDLDLVDESGVSLGKTFFQTGKQRKAPEGMWQQLLVRNNYPGCSLVFDRRILELALPFPSAAIMHDWWIMLLFSLIGNTVALKSPAMCYRVHSDNVKGVGSLSKSFSATLSSGLLRTGAGNVSAVIRQGEIAAARVESAGLKIPARMRLLLDSFDHSRLSRILPLLRSGVFFDRPRWESTLFIFSLLISKKCVRDGGGHYT